MSEPESNRFADPAVWLVVFLFGLLFYVFAYPAVFLLIISVLSDPLIEAIAPVINSTFAPLEWLYETVPIYEAYLDFLEDRLF